MPKRKIVEDFDDDGSQSDSQMQSSQDDEDTELQTSSNATVVSGTTNIVWAYDAGRKTWTRIPAVFEKKLNVAAKSTAVTKKRKFNAKMVLKEGGKTTDVQFDADTMHVQNMETGWTQRLAVCVELTSGSADQPEVVIFFRKKGRVQIPVSYTETIKYIGDETELPKDVERMEVTLHPAVLQPKQETVEKKPKVSAATTTSTKTSGGSKSGPKKVSKSSSSAAVSGRKKGGGEKEEDENKPLVKKVVVKGKAPVDPECVSMVDKAHVYYENNDVYDAMLNQTNVQFNNNKYYICQLLEEDNRKCYYVWFRWGRVGKKGQNNLLPFGPSLQAAKDAFKQKFYDKTRNHWEERHEFEKVAGKYDMLKMDYNASGEDEVDVAKNIVESSNKRTEVESKLHPDLKRLVELVCSIRAMESSVKEMMFDARKQPLGKLTKEQIRDGFAALKKIEDCVTNKIIGKRLIEACNEYYTRIPHDFGMRTPPLIRTPEELRKEIQLLETLSDIRVAIKLLKEEVDSSINPIDRHYISLGVNLQVLDETAKEYQLLSNYVNATHGSTHSRYKLSIVNAFQVERSEECSKFRSDLSNQTLLFHGSRISNWACILSQGLRIAPPEAPVSGYMFGKGVYFADCSSKSANYCFATPAQNEGLLVVCQVALGEKNLKIDADYNAHRLPPNKHSVMGLGRLTPNPAEHRTIEDSVLVPCGKLIDAPEAEKYTLQYNEYIVYDIKQVKMRYLIRLRFDFV